MFLLFGLLNSEETLRVLDADILLQSVVECVVEFCGLQSVEGGRASVRFPLKR